MNILITAASRRVPLVQAFRNALGALGMPGRVVVTDVNPLSPAVHVADRAYRVPLADDPDYLTSCWTSARPSRIRLVDPDDRRRAGAVWRVASALPHRSARWRPARRRRPPRCATTSTRPGAQLAAAGVPAARTYLPRRAARQPDVPAVHQAARRPRRRRRLPDPQPARARLLPRLRRPPVVQEYLDGPEYTIDVLCDSRGRPLSIVPRERVVIRAGVIDRGRTVKTRRCIELAEQVCAAIPFFGPINIQCRMRDGWPSVFEINPRFSGGIPLTMPAGADFPKMLIRLAHGRHAGAAGRRVPRRPLDDQLRGVVLPRRIQPAAAGVPGADRGRRSERGGVMRTRAGIILQARFGSSRLPGKALATIGGRTVLEHCLRRLMSRASRPSCWPPRSVPRTTPWKPWRALGVGVFRGDAHRRARPLSERGGGLRLRRRDPRDWRQPGVDIQAPGPPARRPARQRRRLRVRGRAAVRRRRRGGDARRARCAPRTRRITPRIASTSRPTCAATHRCFTWCSRFPRPRRCGGRCARDRGYRRRSRARARALCPHRPGHAIAPPAD